MFSKEATDFFLDSTLEPMTGWPSVNVTAESVRKATNKIINKISLTLNAIPHFFIKHTVSIISVAFAAFSNELSPAAPFFPFGNCGYYFFSNEASSK